MYSVYLGSGILAVGLNARAAAIPGSDPRRAAATEQDRGNGVTGHRHIQLGKDTALMTPSSGSTWHAETLSGTPVRVLVLRGVDGSGGGADKIILRNAAQVRPERVQMTLCFMRHRDDRDFDFRSSLRRATLALPTSVASRPDRPYRAAAAPRPPARISTAYHSFTRLQGQFLCDACSHERGGPLRLATSHGWTGDG